MSAPHFALPWRAGLCLLASLVLSSGCGSNPVGAACEFTIDCPSGQSCWTRVDAENSFPDGLCTHTCERAGRTDRCPSGSVCAQTGGRLLCAPTCSIQDECRDGYSCSPSNPGVASPAACVLLP